ncbi:MBL fold metallo-hydrolase [Virgibacillus oceani]
MPLDKKVNSMEEEWEVIYTPGHAGDHVAFYQKQTRCIFTGDLFVTSKPQVIMDSESIPQTINSIRKLLTYEFHSIFCSHAGFIEEGRTKLASKLDYLEYLSGEVAVLYKQGYTEPEIRERLFPIKYAITDISNGEWDSLHIITSIISAIDKKTFS